MWHSLVQLQLQDNSRAPHHALGRTQQVSATPNTSPQGRGSQSHTPVLWEGGYGSTVPSRIMPRVHGRHPGKGSELTQVSLLKDSHSSLSKVGGTFLCQKSAAVGCFFLVSELFLFFQDFLLSLCNKVVIVSTHAVLECFFIYSEVEMMPNLSMLVQYYFSHHFLFVCFNAPNFYFHSVLICLQSFCRKTSDVVRTTSGSQITV